MLRYGRHSEVSFTLMNCMAVSLYQGQETMSISPEWWGRRVAVEGVGR